MSDINGKEVRIGVIACNIMRRELDALLERMPQIAELVYLEVALHCYPEEMKRNIKEQIDLIKDRVDAVFLGYGYCQSLKSRSATRKNRRTRHTQRVNHELEKSGS